MAGCVSESNAIAEGLQHAYSAPEPFQRDGVYLLHKEGHYSLDSTPLAVLWKDGACSRYCIDTDAQGVASEHQVCSGVCCSIHAAASASCRAHKCLPFAICNLACDMQSVTLEYCMDQTVATSDSPPVALGRMPAQFVKSMGSALR